MGIRPTVPNAVLAIEANAEAVGLPCLLRARYERLANEVSVLLAAGHLVFIVDPRGKEEVFTGLDEPRQLVKGIASPFFAEDRSGVLDQRVERCELLAQRDQPPIQTLDRTTLSHSRSQLLL